MLQAAIFEAALRALWVTIDSSGGPNVTAVYVCRSTSHFRCEGLPIVQRAARDGSLLALDDAIMMGGLGAGRVADLRLFA